jgi:glycosyltransferase involved in cell wall biosynthesis
MSKDEARKQIGARPGDRILLYVGRVAKEKNIPLLVEAVAQVLLASPNLRFFMVGDGPFRKQAQQMARDFGVGDQVRFAGAVARSEVDKYYLASDLFVFASTTETQGLVVGEAMTYGLPTVAVHGGGASASIRDGSNGFIVGNSAGALAEKIDEVMSTGVLRAQLSACARASVKSWTHSDSCDQVLRVYEEVLGK